ncbi:MAG: DNA recombination protein RmuC [Jiangellaceae bacterium]
MNGIDLLLLALAVALGASLGAMAVRARSAAAHAERDAARAERDSMRAERADAQAERTATEARLRESESACVRLTADLSHARTAADEKLAMLREEQERLVDEFERLSAQALRSNNEQFLQLAGERLKSTEQRSAAELEQRRQAVDQLVKPLTEQLGKVEAHLAAVEHTRTEAYSELREQVKGMRQTSEQLRAETSQLVTALRAPQVRGRWGEMQLRRVVEAAGMVEHCDFDEQASIRTDDGLLRPDLVVRMAGGKNVVVDAKVPFAGWLEAMEAREDHQRAARLKAHVRHVKEHLDDLAAKKYWEHLDPTPEFVVMFVPAEVFLNGALEEEPALLEYAFERNVVIATPQTLVALLRTVAYTWRQEALARNAQEVLRLGRDLHGRLATLGGHVGKLGSALNAAVRQYNSTVGSLEGRVLVTARRFADLKVTEDVLTTPAQVEVVARQVQAPELVASATEALIAIDDIETDVRYGIDRRPERGQRDGTAG